MHVAPLPIAFDDLVDAVAIEVGRMDRFDVAKLGLPQRLPRRGLEHRETEPGLRGHELRAAAGLETAGREVGAEPRRP